MADLDQIDEHLSELLCAQEQERARQILGARERQRWRRGRGLLRALLASYLNRDASTLRFAAVDHGKPALVGVSTAHAPAPWFNIAHSRQFALFTFSTAGPVGVDLEVDDRALDVVTVARRAFGSREARRLQTLEPSSRRREFLSAWTRYEAELKCTGVGIGAREGQRALPWVLELDLGRERVGAVASERPPHELSCWLWPPEAGET